MWEWVQFGIDFIYQMYDLVMHMDRHLDEMIQYFGPWVYVVLFLIIFAETGLVVTPILPGDSLLFALGAFAGLGSLDLITLLVLLCIAAVLGDTVNYWIGAWIGPRVFSGEHVRFMNRKHLEMTHEFYERYGGKTIILARFVPIVRTFAPFVAGMGKMTYRRFMAYNVIGGLVWINLFLWGGYFFGSQPFVKKNFTLVMLAIVFVSVLPAAFEIAREWLKQRKSPSLLPPGEGGRRPDEGAFP